MKKTIKSTENYFSGKEFKSTDTVYEFESGDKYDVKLTASSPWKTRTMWRALSIDGEPVLEDGYNYFIIDGCVIDVEDVSSYMRA